MDEEIREVTLEELLEGSYDFDEKEYNQVKTGNKLKNFLKKILRFFRNV